MKEDSSGDYIWIPFTHLKIEFNDAKSGWFQCFHSSRLQPARLMVNQTRLISDKMKPFQLDVISYLLLLSVMRQFTRILFLLLILMVFQNELKKEQIK